jgi:hypothetical protein
MPPVRSPVAATATLLALLAPLAAGCGSDDDATTEDPVAAAPAASSFPPAEGTLEDLFNAAEPTDEIVVSPATQAYVEGKNRFGFGVFSVDGEQITDADVAIYAARGPSGKAQGPYPAEVESLETEPAFTAANTANDPDAAKAVYVTELELDEAGEWRLLALIDQGDGSFAATRVPSAVVVTAAEDKVPDVGEKAPVIHTPTTEDVGDVSEIDTRIPPSSMHDVDFADVVGKEPVVLLFATPALCQSRVCGPVVDVTEQVKRDRPDDAEYIHMEIWNDNDPNKGAREQVLDYNLRTEPWLFVINSDGTVSARIEGAFSIDELNAALDGTS